MQLLRQPDSPTRRAIIGTWESREDRESWHHDETFVETREHLDGLQADPAETVWYDVVTGSQHS